MSWRGRAWAVVLVAVAVAAPRVAAASDEPPSPPAAKERSDVRTVSGTIRSVAPGDQAFTLETEDGVVRLLFDRNTTVFLPERIATVRALQPGKQARAAFGARHHAYWIELGGSAARLARGG